jgi:anti-anti-sigma factor
MVLAERALVGVGGGDHVCCAWDSEAQQQALVGRFGRDALARGERLLYVADRSDEATVREFLEAAGVNAARALESGRLQIEPASEVYEPPFDPDRQIAHFEAEKRAAREAGFSGLAVLGEMSWALREGHSWDSVVGYEKDVQTVFATADVRGVCQYDTRLFAPDLLEEALSAHQVAVAINERVVRARWRTATITESSTGGAIHLSGELDLASGPYLEARLAEHLPGGEDIMIDAAELSFVDVSGCRALMRTALALRPPRRLVLQRASPKLLRMLELCQWRDLSGLRVGEEA